MNRIEVVFDDVLLKGVILKREKFYIEVQLLSPYKSWDNHCIISGMCRETPSHFLTEYGDKTIRRLLIESYQKSKILSDSFNRISKVYRDYKSELISLNEISDIKIKNKIKRKLQDWFFNAIFTSGITGVIASNNDRNYIFEILENYLKQNGNKGKGNEYGIWLEKLIDYLNKKGLEL